MNAENYAALLYFVLKKLGADVAVVDGDFGKTSAHVGSIRGSGVYSIWVKPAGKEGYVPTYFGCTSREFGTRLREHCRQGGKIHQLYQGGAFDEISGIGIVYIDTHFPSAKAMESIFLSVFDFAQNVAENADPRALDQGFGMSDLDEDPPLPDDACDIEAFNYMQGAISEQIKVMEKLRESLQKLKG